MPVDRHRYAVVGGIEEAVEASVAFVVEGLDDSERVILVGSTYPGTNVLLTRLQQNGADPGRAVRHGQLVIVDQVRTSALSEMPPDWAVDELSRQAGAAVRDGYTGIRFGGLIPGTTLGPHEHTLSKVIRQHPATALCLYHAQAPAEVLHTVHDLHDARMPSPAIFDDGDLRITTFPRTACTWSGGSDPATVTACWPPSVRPPGRVAGRSPPHRWTCSTWKPCTPSWPWASD
jgi:hypothetical protein